MSHELCEIVHDFFQMGLSLRDNVLPERKTTFNILLIELSALAKCLYPGHKSLTIRNFVYDTSQIDLFYQDCVSGTRKKTLAILFFK